MNKQIPKLYFFLFLLFFSNFLTAQNEQIPDYTPTTFWELPSTPDQPNVADAIIPFSIRPQQLNRDYRDNGTQEDDVTWSLKDGYGGSCDRDCNIAPYDNAPLSNSCNGGNYNIPYAITIVNVCGTTNLPDGWTNAADAIGDLDVVINQINSYYTANGLPIQLTKAIHHGMATETDGSTRIISDATLCSFSGGTGPGSDNAYADGLDIPNVLNIYVAEVVNGSTGCNGFAFLPTGPSAPNRTAMQASCFNSFACPPSNPATNPGRNGVLIHEVGHYLGLYHTHHPYEVNDVSPIARNECPDGSNGCTAGDFIADTGADPNLEDSCVVNPNTFPVPTDCDGHDVSACTSPCGSPYVSATTAENVMSYNRVPIVSGNTGPGYCETCRSMFSDCQKAKMVDALLCSRNTLCDRSIATDLSGGAASSVVEICLGDPAPTFTATSSCYSWYDGLGANSQLLTAGTSSFTPTVGAAPGQLNNQAAGTYTFYLGDVNEYNSNCRTAIEVIVLGEPGDGSPSFASFSGVSTTSLSTDATSLGNFEVIGWWITENTGVSIGDFANQAALDAALAAANSGGSPTISTNTVNHIFPSTDGTPTTMLELTMDCGSLDDGITYFATPFISTLEPGIPDASCVETDAGSNVSVGLNEDLGQWAFINAGTVNCAPASPPNDPIYTLTINVTSYTGAANNLLLRVRGNGCSTNNLIAQTVAGVGTYTFTEADFAGGYDPNIDGLCVLVYESGSGSGGSGIGIDISLDITYPGTSTIPFPTVNYSTCLFGAPVEISCLTATPVELYTFSGQLNEGIVRLDWKTIAEENNDYFTLSRSADGRNFTTIAKVKGNGTTLDAHTYQHLDKEPMSGLNYYRLQQTDFDGTIVSVGSIVVVDNDKLPVGIQVRPNPIRSGELALSATVEAAGNLEVQIYSMNGALMFRTQTNVTRGHNRLTFKVDDLPNGVYLLKTLKDQVVYTERFVKTN